MDIKQILKKVKKVEITTKGLVDGIMQGAYHSIFKGRGMEFSDVREYCYGDEIKSIDWNVTARMDKPYIKEFVEERDLTAYIIFDASGSNDFGYEKQKKETMIEIAASLIFAAQKNNDNVGLFIFTDKIEKFIPARKGKKHALKLIRELIHHNPKNKQTNIKASLEYIAKVIKKRNILFLISDFDDDNFQKQLQILKKRNDMIPINISDLRENTLPNLGYIELTDPETGEDFIINTNDKELIKEYYKLLKKQDSQTDKIFKKNKIEQIHISSDEDYVLAIKNYFKKRLMKINR